MQQIMLFSSRTVIPHEIADFGDGATARFTTVSQARHQAGVVCSLAAEPALTQFMLGAKTLDLGKDIVHSTSMRRIYPSGQEGDGYIRKLIVLCGSWDSAQMATNYNLETIKQVLIDATGKNGPFSRRNLSKAAGEGRDCVGDIINGRNKNPTVKVLSNLAEALGHDLSVFGIAGAQPDNSMDQTAERGAVVRSDPVSEAELEIALRQFLPSLPRGSVEKRARFLAEALSRALALPPSRQTIDPTFHSIASAAIEEGAPAPASTK